MTQKKVECEACKTCDNWNNEEGCTFSGICELCVDPKLVDNQNFLLYGDRDEC